MRLITSLATIAGTFIFRRRMRMGFGSSKNRLPRLVRYVPFLSPGIHERPPVPVLHALPRSLGSDGSFRGAHRGAPLPSRHQLGGSPATGLERSEPQSELSKMRP